MKLPRIVFATIALFIAFLFAAETGRSSPATSPTTSPTARVPLTITTRLSLIDPAGKRMDYKRTFRVKGECLRIDVDKSASVIVTRDGRIATLFHQSRTYRISARDALLREVEAVSLANEFLPEATIFPVGKLDTPGREQRIGGRVAKAVTAIIGATNDTDAWVGTFWTTADYPDFERIDDQLQRVLPMLPISPWGLRVDKQPPNVVLRVQWALPDATRLMANTDLLSCADIDDAVFVVPADFELLQDAE